MMKLVLFLSLLLFTTTCFCQEKFIPADSFLIEGKVKNTKAFSLHDLDSFTVVSFGDITTVNHLGEVKSNRKNVKGILLKNILVKVKFNVTQPKELNSYYFILKGTDGYKVVLSYSEIFNNSNVYIVTESNGKGWQQIEDRVAVLVLLEPHKGHVAMKGLYKLVVEQAM